MSLLTTAARKRAAVPPSLVQQGATIGTSPQTVTLTTTTGNLLVAFIGGSNITGLPSPWTQVVAPSTGTTAARCSIWARTAPGGSTGTSTDGTASNTSLIVAEFAHASTTALATDADADVGSSVDTLAIGPTTSTASGLVVACAATNGSVTSPALSGLTTINSTLRLVAGWAVASGAHSTTATWTTIRRATGAIAAMAAA